MISFPEMLNYLIPKKNLQVVTNQQFFHQSKYIPVLVFVCVMASSRSAEEERRSFY